MKRARHFTEWRCDARGCHASIRVDYAGVPVGWRVGYVTFHDCGLTGYTAREEAHYCPAHVGQAKA